VKEHQHQHQQHHEKRRQPAALPDRVCIPVLTTTSRLCRPTDSAKSLRTTLG